MTMWLDANEVGKKPSLRPETISGKIFIDWESVLEWLAKRRILFPD